MKQILKGNDMSGYYRIPSWVSILLYQCSLKERYSTIYYMRIFCSLQLYHFNKTTELFFKSNVVFLVFMYDYVNV